MISEKLTEEELTEKQEKVKSWKRKTWIDRRKNDIIRESNRFKIR